MVFLCVFFFFFFCFVLFCFVLFFYLRYVTVTVSENNMSYFIWIWLFYSHCGQYWLDQECINQECIKQRKYQLILMKKIPISELKKECEIYRIMLRWLGLKKKKKKKGWLAFFQQTQNFGKLGLLLFFCLFVCLFVSFVCLFVCFLDIQFRILKQNCWNNNFQNAL